MGSTEREYEGANIEVFPSKGVIIEALSSH
jgi:hypothetical protein